MISGLSAATRMAASNSSMPPKISPTGTEPTTAATKTVKYAGIENIRANIAVWPTGRLYQTLRGSAVPGPAIVLLILVGRVMQPMLEDAAHAAQGDSRYDP
jgi:hypothetical protein